MNAHFPLPQIDWPTVMPITLVITTGVIALIVEMLLPRKNNNTVVAVSLVGLLAAAWSAFRLLGAPTGDTFAGMVHRDHIGTVFQILLIGVCFVSFLFSERYLREKGIAFAEFYPLALWATSGGMIMASTTNLLVIFLGLEVLSIALYCLVGMSRREQKSEEGALKYFLLGAFASAFFLYGVALIYGATGTTDLATLKSVELGEFRGLLLMGVTLILVGFGFKVALVPFHQWTPDVYQGAPTNVTAFMAAASKIAAVAALFRVLVAAVNIQIYWLPVLSVLAILTMVVGNLFAIAQKDVKRILAYSAIAHAGYILVALLAHLKDPAKVGMDAVVYYLLAYSLMTIVAFAVVTLTAKGNREQTRLQDLNGLWQTRPFAAVVLVLAMVSQIGRASTAGFLGKYMIFVGAIDAGLAPLAYVLAATSAVSVFYYWAIARATWIEEEGVAPAPKAAMSPGLWLTCAICAFGILGCVVFASPVLDFIRGTSQPPPAVQATLNPNP